MTAGRRISAGAAALGTLCLLLLPFARGAGAAERPIDIFDARGIGQGLVATFAVRPSIFDPLVQGGVDYVQTTFNSQGGGQTQSIAAPAFPGMFALGALTGAVGCGGLKGWVEARYPTSQACKGHQEDALIEPARSSIGEAFGVPQADDAINAVLARAKLGVGLMSADAAFGSALATIRTGGFSIGDAATPVIEVGDMLLRSGGARDGEIVTNTVQVIAKEIVLLGGIVTIDTLVSTAHTRSDGTAGVADASLTFGTVLVEVDGEKHEATIDDEGVRITDADLDEEARLGIQEQIDEALLSAGLGINASSPTELTDGAQADAAVGGLTLSFSAELPSVPVPDQLAPVYGQLVKAIPTKCVREITHEDRPDELAPVTDGLPQVPLCFGAGVVPLGGSVPAVQLTLASAQSFTVGAHTLEYRPPMVEGPGPLPSPMVPVIVEDPGGFSQPPVSGPGPSIPPPSSGGTPPVVPVGLVARMPAVALAWAGAAFLVLAVGYALAPSLRHAGSQ